MDRFIASSNSLSHSSKSEFKIQYGEIYSNDDEENKRFNTVFKIQYGEIYRLLLVCT